MQRVANALTILGSEEIIIVRAQGQDPLSFTDSVKIRTAWDIQKEGGPLVAIYSGLLVSSTDFNVVVACDMPFLNIELLRYIIGLATKLTNESVGFDAVVPRVGGKPERLHALYRKSCLGPMERLIKEEKFRVGGFLEKIKVRYVEEAEIDRFEGGRLSLFNINTESDLQKARAIAQGQRPE